MMADPVAFKAFTDKNLALGFYNHSFMPMGIEGPCFCFWETKADKTPEAFQAFIDGYATHACTLTMMLILTTSVCANTGRTVPAKACSTISSCERHPCPRPFSARLKADLPPVQAVERSVPALRFQVRAALERQLGSR